MNATAAAEMLQGLAQNGQTIAALPANLRPSSIEEAYAIQSVPLRDRPAYGWKVGPGEVPGVPRAAPLRGQHVFLSPHSLAPRDWATMSVEVEVAIVLNHDLTGQTSLDDARGAIGSIHLAYELFRSRFTDRMAMDFPSLLADHLSNDGIVLGPAHTFDDGSPLETLAICLFKDGTKVAETATGPTNQTMLEQLHWLANHAAGRGSPLAKGTAILTGARIGPVSVADGKEFMATSSLGNIALTL
jgi:2-keto-4-pentenoate hydratase